MRRALALLALAIGGLAIAASTSTPPGMGAPASAGWGSSTEPAPMPTAPNVPHLPWLQTLIDQAPAGSTLKPPPGIYSGPVLVNKPLVIDGGGEVTIDGGGKGTVFVLETNSSTLRGLHLKNSGASHDSDDACLNVRGNHNTIESLVISDCLFGIDLKQASDNLVRGNRISSKPLSLGLRGDGLRLWYSMNNRIENNEVIDSRDMVVWYSNGNAFRDNLGRRSRYSIHFMFAKDNEVVGNRFYDNAVGVYLMYTERVHVRSNVISHATGATGMGIGFKEASDSIIEGNEIIYCAVGIGSDLSPFEPDSKIEFRNNRIAYNGIGIMFTSDLGGNLATDNVFEGNLTHVMKAGRGGSKLNVWRGNYWDDYEGFDRNADNVGDTPYELYAFADRIWMEIPPARFFKTSPALEALDFLERLAPFSSPDLMLRDESPRFKKQRAQNHERG
ncbi:MAG: nitrous oxide reductase family maturation protein NosD [Sulfuritalea sp.]|nr:nitrous oxide reductase family maturation protein NosD [Sulfuritalea sp.]